MCKARSMGDVSWSVQIEAYSHSLINNVPTKSKLARYFNRVREGQISCKLGPF